MFPELRRKVTVAKSNPDYQRCHGTDGMKGVADGPTSYVRVDSRSDEVIRHAENAKQLVAVEYIGFRLPNGDSKFAYLSVDKAKKLQRKRKIRRIQWNDMLSELALYSATVQVNDVPQNGRLSYLHDSGEQEMPQSYAPPSDRGIPTVAEWHDYNAISISTRPFAFALHHAFGKYNCARPSAGGTSGICYYQSYRDSVVSTDHHIHVHPHVWTNSISHFAVIQAMQCSPRTPPEGCKESQLFDSTMNAVL